MMRDRESCGAQVEVLVDLTPKALASGGAEGAPTMAHNAPDAVLAGLSRVSRWGANRACFDHD
eukprot:3482961-Alexandrium_andersonii.AAC.1